MRPLTFISLYAQGNFWNDPFLAWFIKTIVSHKSVWTGHRGSLQLTCIHCECVWRKYAFRKQSPKCVDLGWIQQSRTSHHRKTYFQREIDRYQTQMCPYSSCTIPLWPCSRPPSYTSGCWAGLDCCLLGTRRFLLTLGCSSNQYGVCALENCYLKMSS